jgi:heterodisulfide reductase subunit C
MLVTAHNAINDMAHTRVEDCYQCGKCTAGCPAAEWMDLMPNQVIRFAQTGDDEEPIRSAAVWLCVACQTCSERCPKSVDIAGVMDAYRQLSAERGTVSDRVRRTLVFQRAFLDSVRKNGRLNELEMIRLYKTRAFARDLNIPLLFRDAMLAPRSLARHKLHFRGERVADRDVVNRIFDRCMKQA